MVIADDRSNLEEIDDYVALGDRLGVNEVRCIPLRPIGKAVESGLTQPSLTGLFMALQK